MRDHLQNVAALRRDQVTEDGTAQLVRLALDESAYIAAAYGSIESDGQVADLIALALFVFRHGRDALQLNVFQLLFVLILGVIRQPVALDLVSAELRSRQTSLQLQVCDLARKSQLGIERRVRSVLVFVEV